MSEENIYPISETIKYSDGSEKVVNFKLPEEEIKEDEVDAEIVASEVEEKEAAEAPADSIEESA